MTETKKTLYLVDGTALAYRGYFAFIRNPLINSRGENTSAPFAVTNTLLSILRDKKPDYLAVVFDTGKPTFRHEMYDQYKATRQKMPNDMVGQLPRVREAIDALGIVQLEKEGFEADDVIGTLAKRGADAGYTVWMVTGDKDFMQLVGGSVFMYDPGKNELIDAVGVRRKMGVGPELVVDLLGLMGDSSDNVPGVPRVGEKTARELLEQFGSLGAVLDGWEAIKKPSIRTSVSENRVLAELSRRLVTIDTDVDLDCEIDNLAFPGIQAERARKFFQEMEFTSLLKQVSGEADKPRREVAIVTSGDTDAFFAAIAKESSLAIDLETTSLDPMRAEIVGVSVAAAGGVWYVPVGHSEGENVDREITLARFRDTLENPAVEKCGHNAKYDALILRRNGVEVNPISFDTMLAAYVLDPGSRGYALDKLSEAHLNHRMQSIKELIGSGRNQKSFAEVDIESAARYSGDDAAVTFRLREIFGDRIREEGLEGLFHDLEMPLLCVLMDVEMRGVCLDTVLLGELSENFAGRIAEIEKKIYASAGEEFNINSPKQLGSILFEKLGLPTRRKTKTGYSTDMDTLTTLVHKHELPGLVIDYRQLAKLKSTYIDALPEMINPRTGRVHTSFNQAVTATGRLSSSDPNLQNIPIRTELGREIRKAFVAPKGYVLLSADYSQIELRIMAHMSGDAVLREAFLNGEDVHRKTASILFGITPAEVTNDQRRQAKTINFGVMYGMGAYSLSEQLGISRGEAKDFIDNYFQTHTGVSAFIETTISEAQESGYVTTLLGRRRSVTDIHSDNHNVAEFAKRTAINTPIQGSAADLIKRSMIDLSKRLKQGGYDAHMIMQVHDELVLEVRDGQVDDVRACVKETMEGAIALDVPLVVDIGIGANWFEAH